MSGRGVLAGVGDDGGGRAESLLPDPERRGEEGPLQEEGHQAAHLPRPHLRREACQGVGRASYRVTHHISDLCWVDFVLGSFLGWWAAAIATLLGEWNIQNLS